MAGAREKRLEWSDRALLQLAAQFEYIIAEKLIAPEIVMQRVDQTASLLVQYPKIGALGRRSGTRELLVKDSPLTLVYRVKTSKIEIVAIVHRRQFFR